MAKDLLSRKCSHCGNNGHNSRTCCSRVVKLFGVRLTATDVAIQIKKSISTGNLLHYNRGFACIQSDSGAAAEDGYFSDGLFHTSSKSRDRKKGVPWTEQEHRMFLVGLEKLGKGDWRGISRNFVTSRTPTQVASHAQKYFLRQSSSRQRKRRSSLFDMCPHTENDSVEKLQELSSDLELSVGVPPNLEQTAESMANTQPQLLLPLWPELQTETCSSNSNTSIDCVGFEPLTDGGEHSELSLSIAPPSGNSESTPTQLPFYDSKLNFDTDFISRAAIIRVV